MSGALSRGLGLALLISLLGMVPVACDDRFPALRVVSHPGGHRVTDDGSTARDVLAALGI